MSDKAILKEIAKRFFLNNPVKIAQSFSGQGITASNCYKLGTRAGPEQSVGNLLHEMGHLAERPVKIIKERPHHRWGFSFGKYWEVFGHSGWEPQTDQQVLCEARVWSYQLSLHRELGIEQTVEDLVESAVYLPAFCMFQYKHENKSQQFALDRLADIVEKGTVQYSYQAFVEAWNLRMKELKA